MRRREADHIKAGASSPSASPPDEVGLPKSYPPNVRSITDAIDPGMRFMIKAGRQRFRGVITHFT